MNMYQSPYNFYLNTVRVRLSVMVSMEISIPEGHFRNVPAMPTIMSNMIWKSSIMT